ncbi:MAG: WYL domain-containing transcriptional regulator [Myxococcales bacterium]|nr:WYL domain-containing transcriptional regulator [Myxococcales bacterium]
MLDADLNKSQKFVRIIELVSRRGGVQAQVLIDRFGLDARTLRRYLADLHDLGLPIEDTGTAMERTISIAPTYARSGVQLTLAEVLSLHFGRTLYTFLEGTSFAADMEGAIERLQPAIARSTADLTQNIDRKFMAVGEHAKNYANHPDLLDEVISSLLYCNPADAEYRGVRGLGKIYRLEPLTLAVYRQGLYLYARDVTDSSGKIKSFAVERFERYSRLRRESFVYPPQYDPRDQVASSFGITGGKAEDVTARFSPEVAFYIRERLWHPTQRLEKLPDGGVRLKMRVVCGPELKEWLLGFGAHARVDAPDDLVDWVREAHRAALASYGG